MEHKTQIPTYEKIAIDIANRIYNGSLKVGDKMYGRSILASEYNVSPETIRRAIKILEDVEIVHSSKGSGIVVLSKEKALYFINRFTNLESIRSLENKIHDLLETRKQIDETMQNTINDILSYSGKYRNINPLLPIELELTASSDHLGKTISETFFWQNTGGTIIGIKREGTIIVSPGPYALLQEGDILLIVGDDKIYERVSIFLKTSIK